jgi:hypothetical protein
MRAAFGWGLAAAMALVASAPAGALPRGGGPCGWSPPTPFIDQSNLLRSGVSRRHGPVHRIYWPTYCFGYSPGFYGYYPGFFGFPYAPTYGFGSFGCAGPNSGPIVGLPHGYSGYLRAPFAYGSADLPAGIASLLPGTATQESAQVPFATAGGEGFYLERKLEPSPTSLVDAVRSQLRAETAEPGTYLVRWNGSRDGVSLVEFQSIDALGQVLGAKSVREAPSRGLLRVPEKTAAVVVSVEMKNGSSASVKLPLAEFKALAEWK